MEITKQTVIDLIARVENLEAEVEKLKKKPANRGVRPTVEECRAAFVEKEWKSSHGDDFFNYFESCGWLVGAKKAPMKSYKAAIANWIKKMEEKGNRPDGRRKQPPKLAMPEREEEDNTVSRERMMEILEARAKKGDGVAATMLEKMKKGVSTVEKKTDGFDKV